MNEREIMMLDAAVSVFARYGVKKTTMGDIAEAAGVARQTLYNAYPGKGEVIRAAVRHVGATTYDAVCAAWKKADTLEDKLEAFLVIGPLAWYDRVQESPDTAELIEGIHAAAQEEMEALNSRFTTLLEEMFRPHAEPIEAAGMTIETFADFVFTSAHGAKHTAPSRAVVEARLNALKQTVLTLIGKVGSSD